MRKVSWQEGRAAGADRVVGKEEVVEQNILQLKLFQIRVGWGRDRRDCHAQ